MENYIEEMVVKKRSGMDVLLVLALGLACTFIGFLLFNLSAMFPALSSIFFFVIVGCFYLAYTFSVSRNLEYEYSMVNHEIDIDKIANRKKRKKMTVLNVKKMEAFGKKGKDSQYEKFLLDFSVKKVFACRDKKADDVYYAVYFEDGVRKMLLFSPSQDIVDRIVKLNPRETYAI